MSVTYSSTRGGQKNLDFRTVVMQGLAHDRGLFVPDSMPSVTSGELESWRSLSYPDLAVKVISKFVKEDPADIYLTMKGGKITHLEIDMENVTKAVTGPPGYYMSIGGKLSGDA